MQKQLRNYTISGESRNHNGQFFSDLLIAEGIVVSVKSLPYQKVNITVLIPVVGVELTSTPVSEFVARYKDIEELR